MSKRTDTGNNRPGKMGVQVGTPILACLLWLAGTGATGLCAQPYLRSSGPSEIRLRGALQPIVLPPGWRPIWPLPTNAVATLPPSTKPTEAAPEPSWLDPDAAPAPKMTVEDTTGTAALAAGAEVPEAASSQEINQVQVLYDPILQGALTPQMLVPYFHVRRRGTNDVGVILPAPMTFQPPGSAMPMPMPMPMPSRATYEVR